MSRDIVSFCQGLLHQLFHDIAHRKKVLTSWH